MKRVFAIPKVYLDLFGAEDSEALKEEILSTPFYRSFLISRDGSVGGLILEIGDFGSEAQERELVQALDRITKPLASYGFAVRVVGAPAFHLEMKAVGKAEGLRTFPVAFAMSTLMLIVLFRSIRATAVTLACSIFSVLLTLGIMQIFRIPLSIVTAGGLPLFIWVLGLANLIHIVRRYQRLLPIHSSPLEALSKALKDTAMPCAVAVLTTALGFLSLLTGELAPIRELGGFTALGLVISLVLSLTVGPLLIQWMRVPGSLVQTGMEARWAEWTTRLAVRRGRLLLGAALAVLIASLFAISRTRIEASVMTFLPKDSDMVKSYDFVNRNLIGLYNLEAVISLPSNWLNAENWPAIEEATQAMIALPGVSRVLSPLDFLKKANQWNSGGDQAFYRLPKSTAEAEELMGLMAEEAQAEISRCVARDQNSVRLSVFIGEMEASRFMPVVKGVQASIDRLPPGFQGYVTGLALQIIEIQLHIIETQLKSFGSAFLGVFVCIVVGLRSVRLAAVSFVTNITPILYAFGLMGLAGITLNPLTVMVASVSLGIGVEDAIHILDAYRRQRSSCADPAQAIQAAISKVGPSISMTTVAACIGFFALIRSYLVAIRFFGMLSGFAMLVALACNLVLVPSILCLRANRPGKETRPKAPEAV